VKWHQSRFVTYQDATLKELFPRNETFLNHQIKE